MKVNSESSLCQVHDATNVVADNINNVNHLSHLRGFVFWCNVWKLSNRISGSLNLTKDKTDQQRKKLIKSKL